MLAYQTHNGVFGPGGHGGGIFQTTVSGLGALRYGTKQGIFGPGGHGGGIFQTTLGATAQEAGASAASPNWLSATLAATAAAAAGSSSPTSVGPMGVYSEATKNTQLRANAILPQIGKPTLNVDGKLGEKTCQAIRDIVASGTPGWSVPAACSVSAPRSGGSSITTTSAALPEGYAYDPGMSTGTKMLIAGGVVLAAVGGYVALKKRR